MRLVRRAAAAHRTFGRAPCKSPTPAYRYTLPIPRAALFGKQVFAASFNEAGALTSLGYNKDSEPASLLSTLQAGAEAVQTTSAEQAAELKTEADVIAAQQRLIGCRTDPRIASERPKSARHCRPRYPAVAKSARHCRGRCSAGARRIWRRPLSGARCRQTRHSARGTVK